LKVLSDLLEAVDHGDVGVLLLLDLSAAFDTVDHETLLRRLELTFGVSGTALSWLASYLSGREYFVRLGADSSQALQMTTGVPQGSVLGPSFFIMYTVDLIELIRSLNLQPHLYADDSQLYGSCRPEDTPTLADRVIRCVELVANWMRSNRLCLNSDKTEVIWVSTPRRQHQLPISPLLIDGSSVLPVRTVRNLGVFIDADLVMRSHVARVVAQCFAVLRRLRLISRLLSPSTLKTVVVALVLSRLDYANRC
jgi:Reverse transcriptase (RNA-dependent DNA polymerase)